MNANEINPPKLNKCLYGGMLCLIATAFAQPLTADWTCVAHENDSLYQEIEEITTWTQLAQSSKPASAPAQAIEAEIADMEGLILTPVLVEINPLGAGEDVPWTVHLETITVRDKPHESGTALGALKGGQTVPGDYHLIKETDEEWLSFNFTHPNSKETQAWLTVTGLQRIHPHNARNLESFANLPIGEEIVNRWWGIPVLYEANDLAQVPPEYTSKGRDDAMLRQVARDSVIRLIDASRADGQEVLVGSPYRSGALQKKIYDRNIRRSGRNQRFSAPPGHSEHQLGLTVDFVDPGDGKFLKNDDPEHQWMIENAPKFGWRQTYTDSNTDETGYVEEPWHWRYIGIERTMSWVFQE